MYTNVGGKIKGLAVFACWLGIIISCSIGLILITNGSNASQYTYGSSGTILIVWGIIVIIGGCIGSWIGSILIYGFGELVENSAIIADDIKKVSDQQKPSDNSGASTSTTPEPKNVKTTYEPVIEPIPASKRSEKEISKESVKPLPIDGDPDNVVCPICGMVQPYKRNICFHCGRRFDKSSS